MRLDLIQQKIQEKAAGKIQKGLPWHKNYSTSSNSFKSDSRRQGTPQLSKERQLRDFYRANNLCFYCWEPYDATLNALAGTEVGEAMKLRCLVKNKVVLILVDSGSSHSFVSSSFLSKVGLRSTPASPKQVKVANGEILFSHSCVPDLEWWIQGHSFTSSMRVLDLEAYDAILGYDWLKAQSPITHDWLHKTMQFSYQGKDVILAGVQPAPLFIQEIPLETMGK